MLRTPYRTSLLHYCVTVNMNIQFELMYVFDSHFDGVRALTFHPVEPVLLTASEDHTMKLWNLQKTVPTKK